LDMAVLRCIQDGCDRILVCSVYIHVWMLQKQFDRLDMAVLVA
jgi:hypothetical protein